jgi:hypothetical protein
MQNRFTKNSLRAGKLESKRLMSFARKTKSLETFFSISFKVTD